MASPQIIYPRRASSAGGENRRRWVPLSEDPISGIATPPRSGRAGAHAPRMAMPSRPSSQVRKPLFTRLDTLRGQQIIDGRMATSRAGSYMSGSTNLFSANPMASGAVPSLRYREPSINSSEAAPSINKDIPGVYFRSRRIKKGQTDRPELRVKDPMDIWVLLIPVLGLLVGFASIALLVWDGHRKAVTHRYCHVFTDDFSDGFNSTIWTKEVQLGGYGSVPPPQHLITGLTDSLL